MAETFFPLDCKRSMDIKMKRLIEEIKTGQLKQVYLLYGEESYLRRQYRDKLKSAIISNEDTMNYNYFVGKNIAVGEVIDLGETMPFFADRRLIVLENSGFFKASNEQMTNYMTGVSESTSIVFVEAEVDKRSKLFKFMQRAGTAVEFPVQGEDTLKRWIVGLLKKENKNITEKTMMHLLGKTGTDMENIKAELEKLICYCLDQDVITQKAVDEICSTRISNHIFDMVNAMAEKRQKEAMRLYYDLLALKEPPMRILFLIARQFNILLQVKELCTKGYDNKVIGTKIGLPSFIAGKYVTQASKFKSKDLQDAVTACIHAEESVKTGKMNDIMSVELIIVAYSANI